MPVGDRVPARAFFASLACLAFVATHAAATTLDRVVVRVECAERGGVESPFFLYEREWGVAIDLLRTRSGDASPRHLLDAELGLRLLEARADRLEADAARTDPRAATELRVRRAALGLRVRAGLLARGGGVTAVERLRALHPTFDRAFEALVRRRAGAAIGAEAMGLVSPNLEEGEALELFRQGGHPFEAARFDAARSPFEDWVLVDRLGRAAQRHFEQLRRLVRVSFGRAARSAP